MTFFVSAEGQLGVQRQWFQQEQVEKPESQASSSITTLRSETRSFPKKYFRNLFQMNFEKLIPTNFKGRVGHRAALLCGAGSVAGTRLCPQLWGARCQGHQEVQGLSGGSR